MKVPVKKSDGSTAEVVLQLPGRSQVVFQPPFERLAGVEDASGAHCHSVVRGEGQELCGGDLRSWYRATNARKRPPMWSRPCLQRCCRSSRPRGSCVSHA